MSPQTKPAKKWQSTPFELTAWFTRLIMVFPGVQVEKMFGFPCAFVNGQMFCGMFEDSMFIRLSEADRLALLDAEGAELFSPMPGRPMREYVVVPSTFVDDEELLQPWLEKSFAYTKTLPPKPPKVKKK